MTHDLGDRLTPDEQRARDAVRALDVPRAEPAFRARLKRDFAAGRIAEPRRLVLATPWWRRLRVLVPAAAVAAVIVVAVVNRGPAWSVVTAEGEGVAIVDGAPVPLAHVAEQAWRLRPGARVQVPDGSRLDLAAKGTLMMEIAGGTEVTLPAAPGRWIGRAVSSRMRAGVVRFSTGPGFHGARLHVDTPEAGVEVVGTTLAVICEPTGTCVCVFEGMVHVAAMGGTMEPVSAGRRRFVFNDGRAPEIAEMRPGERDRLGEMHRHRDEWLDGR